MGRLRPDFSGQAGAAWAERTAQLSTLGDRDVLLAVATVDREYYLFSASLPAEITDAEFKDLQVNAIEPSLRERDWAAAAVAAATGLDAAMGNSGSVRTLLIGGAVIVVGAGGVFLYSRKKKRERATAAIEAAREIDPTDTAALAALPVSALDERSREVLVEMDNALRTSAEELDLATGEFGDEKTRPFTTAFDTAKAALAHAFTIRQRLDDNIPETPAEQRDLLVELISTCGKADQELDAQVTEFDGLRDLLIDAPRRLDALTQDLVALTTRVPTSAATMDTLVGEFPPNVLAPVRDNVTQAQERLTFADGNITAGREAASHPAGQQAAVIPAIRAAEGAITQARALLDGVDHAADDIRHAIATLPAALAEARKDIAAADALVEHGGRDLQTAKAGAESALATAEATKDTDPLGSFTALAAADVELDRAITTATTQQRLAQQLDQAITAATAQITAAADFISTRRGAVEAEARTRLSEAQRHLGEAQRLRASDTSVALRHAQSAADLGAQAASAAQADVRQWEQRNTPSPLGGSSGAVLGGIILDSVLRGGFSGGSRGSRWGSGGHSSPGSFGGASSSRRIGGGGRF